MATECNFRLIGILMRSFVRNFYHQINNRKGIKELAHRFLECWFELLVFHYQSQMKIFFQSFDINVFLVKEGFLFFNDVEIVYSQGRGEFFIIGFPTTKMKTFPLMRQFYYHTFFSLFIKDNFGSFFCFYLDYDKNSSFGDVCYLDKNCFIIAFSLLETKSFPPFFNWFCYYLNGV